MTFNMKFIKWWLKTIYTRQTRQLRLEFKGRRLIILQHKWLHFNNHPWEDEKKL